MLLFVVSATAKLTDYSGSDYIPISDGSAMIWQRFEYLRHTTNLSMYAEMVEKTKLLKSHFPQSHMKMILDADIGHINTLLDTINVHHRNTRSINVLGTALKIVAGTPDHDDFENLEFKQRELIEAENRQVLINTKVQQQINNLTDIVNTIVNRAKAKVIDTEHLYETLLARNRILISELESLMLSITLTKVGIVNPQILDSNDLNSMINEHSTNITVTDLMEVAYIKVLMDNKFLHFFIKYPKTDLVCKKVTLYPVQHNNTVLNFDEANSVADCGNQIVAIENCRATLTTSFCKRLNYPTCAQQLHSGGRAYCTTRPSHLEALTVIDEGIIIINDQTVNIATDNGVEQTVTGTFLLTFNDEVKINGSLYRNQRNIVEKLPGSPTSALLNITDHQEILSLPYLQRLNAENLRHIENIKQGLIDGPLLSTTFIFVILIIVFVCFKAHQKIKKTRQKRIIQTAIEDLKKCGDALHLSEGGVNTTVNSQQGI